MEEVSADSKPRPRALKESDLWPTLRAFWHPVAYSREVGDRPLAVKVLDERLVLCRIQGEVRAFHDLCVHRGTPISLGWVENGTLVCAYHGWAYDAEGRCVRIPSVPADHPIPKKACLTSYLTQERYGIVWVCLSPEPRAPIPEFPECDDADYGVLISEKKVWKSSAARVMENFVDQAHPAWVHPGLLGDSSSLLAPEIHLEREDGRLRFWFDQSPDYSLPRPHLREYFLSRPFTLRFWKGEKGGKVEAMFVAVMPNSVDQSTRFLILTRNFDLDVSGIVHGLIYVDEHKVVSGVPDPSTVERLEFLRTVVEQDRAIVENQRPEELPLDLAEELHIRGPDGIALAYRRMLWELGVDN